MPTFIIGAGFNADAAAEAGLQQTDSGYPLVADTLHLCFGLPGIPAGKSIEDLFLEAQERRNFDPIRKLADRLRFADYYVASALSRAERANCYQQFFGKFHGSSFLTFNYDSLPETILFRMRCWFPRDGYGVRVTAPLPPGEEEFAGVTSSALVLHLHGSLCVRTSEYESLLKPGEDMAWLTERVEPLYSFDASSISWNFAPFHSAVGAHDMEDRIIAPDPDKSQGLKQVFIKATYAKAVGILRDSDIVVAIGYSFNPYDRTSYRPLLEALASSKGKRLIVVSPDAGNVAQTIRPDFPDLSIEPLAATFKQWVTDAFPGMR